MSKMLTGKELANFFVGGSANLAANKEQVNALNVFPVPDGDTGTNMGLTMNSAVRDILNKEKASEVASALAHGALMGARGNSGVILSQILRGFGQGLEGKDVADSKAFADAMQKGVDLAYKSVMRPVEGTILTVAKGMAAVAQKAVAQTPEMEVEELMTVMLSGGKKALDNTPNLLPVLKQAGVVDAGGAGLIAIFEGGNRALLGEEFEVEIEVGGKANFEMVSDVDDHSDLVYHYCTEFFIHGADIDIDAYRGHIMDMGDSQVVVGNEAVVKTHIHTDNPGAVLAYAIQFGSLHDLKIDNMKDQHRVSEFEQEEVVEIPEVEIPEVELANCAVVAVSNGEGWDNIFTEMGAAELVTGGQSMNPSAADIVAAINAAPAKEVVILPNNSNIILAAGQAKDLVEKPVYVLPSKFLTQGISALMSFDADMSGEENFEAMAETMAETQNAQITYAVRDSQMDGNEIHEGDILGLLEGKITVVKPSQVEAVCEIVSQMVNEDSGLITLLYGEGATAEDAAELSEILADKFEDCEIEVQFGGQTVYSYLISVE